MLAVDCGSNLFDTLLECLTDLQIPWIARSLTGVSYRIRHQSPRIRTLEDFRAISCSRIIFGGSSRYNPNLRGAPVPPQGFFDWIGQEHIPVLGICYGFQMLAAQFGGQIDKNPWCDPAQRNHYCHWLRPNPLFEGLSNPFPVFLYHKNWVCTLPPNFQLVGEQWRTDTGEQGCPHIAYQYQATPSSAPIFGLQFHPESIYTDANARRSIFLHFWDL